MAANNENAWEEYFDQLLRLSADVESHESGNQDGLDLLQGRVSLALESLHHVYVGVNNERKPLISEIMQNFEMFYQMLGRELQRHVVNPRLAIFQTTVKMIQRDVGRPKMVLDPNAIIYFREIGFNWKEISSMLLVSRWTLARRVRELGLEEITGYSAMSDQELDNNVMQCRRTHGQYCGRSMVTGYLQSKGFRVQQKRITDALVRVDPEGSRIRWASLVKRRRYSVPGPNSLWHMDGHHSLISWGFVIHGAIDGHSRLIVFLKCSTNNRKETVHALFQEAVANFGIPSRIRTDKGGENVMVWEEMDNLRGPHRGSYIAGSSMRNQRIERLWRDVWMCICHEYYYLFQAMETEGGYIT